MRIGQVFDLPMPGSSFATAQDEYGNNRTIRAKELPEDADPGDDMAYYVDFFRGGGTTMINADPDED